MAISIGDQTLQRAMELAAIGGGRGGADPALDGFDEVDRLLELTGESRGAVHQARGRCLAALQERPANRRDLLMALELIDQALDRLERS